MRAEAVRSRRERRRILPWVLVLVAGAACGRGRPAAIDDLLALRSRGDVSVVFILVDALRADRLGAYGYARPTSPAIDALARTGIRFAKVTSQSSWTTSSMASLWTATYPARNGVRRLGQALPQGATTPAEMLAAMGFETAGLLRNPLVGAWVGLGQGFAEYRRPIPREPVPFVRHSIWTGRQPGSDRDLTLDAIAMLRELAPERFLLYLHYMDVHQYAHPADGPSFGSSDSDLYDAAIAWVDRNVAELVRALEQAGLRDRTLIAIASDHGEEFGEHGGAGHGKTLYPEVVRVPLVIALPFRLEPGIVLEEPVENVDLWPTLLALLGMPATDGVDGRSLVPQIEAALLREAPSAPGGPVFSDLDLRWSHLQEAPLRSVLVESGGRSLIWREAAPEPVVELYDLAGDPGQRSDVAAADRARVDELGRDVSSYLGAPPMPWAEPAAARATIDDSLREELHALGYVVK
jgi:arylsulfatase A-like enzyme